MQRIVLLLLLFLSAFHLSAQPVKLLCNWRDTTRAPRIPGGQFFNDCWGFTQGSREYGVIGSTSGAHIIDVNNCREIAYAQGSSAGVQHRAYQVYQHYLYAVADEGITAALQIFDLKYLPDSLHLVYQSAPQDFNRCHDIFIDTATAKLYCASFSLQSTLHDYMRVYSLADPVHPSLYARYNSFGDVHDVFVRNDTAYCSSSYAGYYVIDFTKAPAQTIGILPTYPQQGFNHSSWVGTDGIGVMTDETFGKPVKVIDTRDLGDIQVKGYIAPRGNDITSVPHKPFLRGHFAYISYYMDGFQLWDISNPSAPRQAGAYATFRGVPFQGYAGAWGCYPFLPSRRVLVSDMQNGLFVLDADDAIGINKSAAFSIYPNPATTAISLQLPFGAGGDLQYTIIDIAGRNILSARQTVSGEANPPVTIPLPPTMPAGFYVIRATIAGSSLAARFIKL